MRSKEPSDRLGRVGLMERVELEPRHEGGQGVRHAPSPETSASRRHSTDIRGWILLLGGSLCSAECSAASRASNTSWQKQPPSLSQEQLERKGETQRGLVSWETSEEHNQGGESDHLLGEDRELTLLCDSWELGCNPDLWSGEPPSPSASKTTK